MRKKLPLLSLMLIALAVVLAVPTGTFAAATISAGDYKAGDTVTIEGTIASRSGPLHCDCRAKNVCSQGHRRGQ